MALESTACHRSRPTFRLWPRRVTTITAPTPGPPADLRQRPDGAGAEPRPADGTGAGGSITGRPPLGEAVRWPADTGPCQVRIVTVLVQLHRRYGHAAALPLYQMIAKNVGIRRARGEFILATNIDILFFVN